MSTSALSAYTRFVRRIKRARASVSRPCKRIYNPIISAGKVKEYRISHHSSRATNILYLARNSVLAASNEHLKKIAILKTVALAMSMTVALASQKSEKLIARKTASMRLVDST